MHDESRILVVDGEQQTVNAIADRLSGEGYIAAGASTASDAIDQAERMTPDIVILGSTLEQDSPFELVSRIRSLPSCGHVHVVLLASGQSAEDRIRALKMGIRDVVPKPVDLHEIVVRVETILDAIDRFDRRALKDESTGLYNFIYFEEQFEHAFALAKRYGREFTIVVIDIDNLQSVNESAGFCAGTGVLAATGERLNRILRRVDVVSRLGSDEFAVILPETSGHQAVTVMDRIRGELRSFSADYQGRSISAQASFGHASYSPSFATKEEMFHAADIALSADKKRA